MRASELGIYDPALDRLAQRCVAEPRQPQPTLRELNREKQVHDARDRQREQDSNWIRAMFSDPDVEREELELRKERAKVRRAEYEVEQARLEIEQIRAEIIANMVDAQLAQAEAKIVTAKA